jgi:hypothetical protein
MQAAGTIQSAQRTSKGSERGQTAQHGGNDFWKGPKERYVVIDGGIYPPHLRMCIFCHPLDMSTSLAVSSVPLQAMINGRC